MTTQDLSIFLVGEDGDTNDRLYWFGQPCPALNQTVVYACLQEFATIAEPDARQRITRFLDDPGQALSELLGIDARCRALMLARAKHHRE